MEKIFDKRLHEGDAAAMEETCRHGDDAENRRVSVIIPALNEERSIGKVVRGLQDPAIRQIIVIDNGSTDRTAEIAREAGAEVHREVRKGYGYACLRGLEALSTQSRPPFAVLFMDGDFSDFPEEAGRVLSPVLDGSTDLVIGSRLLGGAQPGSMTLPQRAGNVLSGWMIRWIYGFRFTDLGPFRAIRYDALQALRMTDRTYGWTVEMQVKALKMGLRCAEVPVSYRPRIGKSKVSGTVKGTIFAGVKIISTILRYSLQPPGSWKPPH